VRRTVYLATAWMRALSGPWDVVLTRDLAAASALVRMPRVFRPPVVYESHGFAPQVSAVMNELLTGGRRASPRKQGRLLGRERGVWNRADGYVTITRTLADELIARFGERPRLAIVPDGTRLPHMRAPAARPGPSPVVGYAGHLYPWKGVDLLLEALVHLPHARGLIIGGHPGEPDLEVCRTLALNLGLAHRVRFTGLVPRSEVAARLLEADILVLPNSPTRISSAYTSPLKLFEYMASGRPIVASDLPSLREVLHEDAAVLVAAGESSALAQGIQRLIDDPALAVRIAAVARTRVEDYTWKTRAERLEGLMQTVVESRRR
jgi:glycosyltransferase involved in cell wall biosynthesis